ncbi:MAG: FtsX-like permease family protein [Schaedlerella sp.]|nr:FtsX-like permease family protein [Schaedlerella sp.]
MKNAYWKDIWRTISKGKKRFLSIALIVALGVTMMCGLRAACADLRYSADCFFDEQNLFDIRILSTLGITEEDIEILEDLESVSVADGGYNETIYTIIDEVKKSIEICTVSTKGMNQPYLTDGQMPEKYDEIVITENFLHESGKKIGDKIVLVEESDVLKSKEYMITGTIINTMDVNSTEGSMGFRSTATTDYVGYVSTDAVDTDIYTVLYLKLDGFDQLDCYTDEYKEKVQAVVGQIESEIKEVREKARYDEIYSEAMNEWKDGKQEMLDEFAKADKEITDARKKLADVRWELEDGEKELQSGEAELNAQEIKAKTEFANARNNIVSGYEHISEGKKELQQAYVQLIDGQAQLDAAKAELEVQQSAASQQFEEARQKMAEGEAELAAGYVAYQESEAAFELTKSHLQIQLEQINLALQNPALSEEERAGLEMQAGQIQAAISSGEQRLQAVYGELEMQKQQLNAGKAELETQESSAEAQFAEAWKQINESQAQIDERLYQYHTGVSELQKAEAELTEGEKELNTQEANAYAQIESARQELANGKAKLAIGEAELLDGEKQLAENVAKYEKERAKAEKELADALDKINDIEMTKWYVQDRTSLSGFSNVRGDADSIQAIGDIFPVLFLIVAILISLTTITRMVEEERGLIGTYKALGFTDGEILMKYLIYAALACLIGGIVGNMFGYVILPLILFIVFKVMYTFPEYGIQYDLIYGLGGILFFEIGVVGAALFACGRSLKKMPAELMRPKAPKAGSRVLLERIPFIWKRLSFLNKVTARNLFRYKKRLLMTVFGIAGCTGLLLCGFTIKDTVSEMMPQQYEVVYQYDMMVVSTGEDYKELQGILDKDDEISEYIPTVIESVELINDEGKEETIQLIAVPEGVSLEDYIHLKDDEDQKVELTDEEVLITKNATRIQNLKVGDSVILQTIDLEETEVEITQIVENYFGNIVYMTENTYQDIFGDFKVNSALVQFSEICSDQSGYADKLSREECVLSAISTEAMKEEFSSAFALINMVVYVVLILAAMLAFVVLFTLSNTNISERERELATIKVLGFYDSEVHAYVNKETWILTCIGIFAGMPLGYVLGRYVMGILELPSLEFYIDLYSYSYLIAAAITLVFAFVVNSITDKSLNKINMVEALKSVE